MNAERHQRLMDLLGEALEREPQSRAAWTETACAGDQVMRNEVMRLLARQPSAIQFLEESPLAAALGTEQFDSKSLVGERIGLYKIISEIGRGGMGAVYLAERDDQQFTRCVALKLIKRGMDTDFVVKRFRNERQILASLDHPNIAGLIDGGATEADLPYFIMEYVEGQPITEYANQHSLTTAERLKLFRTVCSAVQYAHQNLVIHRDLKPSNILVTKDGEPKLLDFGIAKLLQVDTAEEAELTATAVRVMTPEYASPEQVKGERVTTATDVYSLGVLLYELLTGGRPYRVKSRQPEELARAICDQEPEKPSNSSAEFGLRNAESKINPQSAIRNPKSLKGDLDNIVLKALRKEPLRRYTSVEQFSEDIRRHLQGLPVIARKDTLAYRSSKFMQRNKIGVAASAVVLFAVLGGFAATAWEARAAQTERAKAERRFNDVRTLVNSLLFQLHDEIEKLPGSMKARELMVRQTLEYLDNVAREASGDAPLQNEIATGYAKLGDVQSKLNAPNLGDTKGALDSYQKALEIRKALFTANPNELPTGLALALAYDRVGDVLSKTNNTKGALDNHRQALDLVEQLATRDPRQTRSALGYSHLMVGRAQLKVGDLPSALDSFRKSEVIREAMAAENPTEKSLSRSLIPSYDSIAFVLSLNGKPAEALSYYRKSQAIAESLVAGNPSNNDFHRLMMDTYEWVGITLGELGENIEGLDYHLKALALCQAQLASDPANAQARDDIADVYHEIGKTLTRLGKPEAALDSFRKSLRSYQSLSDADPSDTNVQRQVYVTFSEMGNAQLLTGNSRGALENYHTALTAFQNLSRGDPTNAETQYDLGSSYRRIGEVQVRMGEVVEALDSYQQALPVFEALVERSPANAKTRADLALTYYDLGVAESKLAPATGLRSDRWQQARSWYQKSLDVWQELRANGTFTGADASRADAAAREIVQLEHLIKQ
jgi:eukaryotic-like serine/threonine-protein kinase